MAASNKAAAVESQDGEKARRLQFLKLCKSVDKSQPKDEDIDELRRMLEETPSLCRLIGDLALQATHGAVEEVKAPASFKESVRTQLKELRRRLGYKDSPPIEQLLIDAVALCWLRLYLAELTYNTKVYTSSCTTEAALFHEKRLTLCQKRYLKSIESLARTRKLLQQRQTSAAARMMLRDLIGRGPTAG